MYSHHQILCLICSQTYTQTNIPLLFSCGHTFCSSCVQRKFHFKKFYVNEIIDKKGKCIVDRTQQIEDQKGTTNKILLSIYIKHKENQQQIACINEEIKQKSIDNSNIKQYIKNEKKRQTKLIQNISDIKSRIAIQQNIDNELKIKSLYTQYKLKNQKLIYQIQNLSYFAKQLDQLKIKKKKQQQFKDMYQPDSEQQQIKNKKNNRKTKNKNKKNIKISKT